MGALPKHKISRHQRGNRRQHLRVETPTLVTCPNCGKLMRAHRVCKECGQYRGRQVVQQEQEAER
jgi:large subunit ribosomal protein L32